MEYARAPPASKPPAWPFFRFELSSFRSACPCAATNTARVFERIFDFPAVRFTAELRNAESVLL